MACENCGDPFEEYSDKAVVYTGKDFPKFNIKSGQRYDKLIVELLNQLTAICEQNVDINCLYVGDCSSKNVTIPEAVKLIINKLCTLTTKDIKYEGEKYCINNDTISKGGVHLLGRNFNYSVQSVTIGTSIGWDVSDLVNSFPTNYRLAKVNIVVSGKPKAGKTIIIDSNKSTMSVNVDNDRFPLTLDVDLRIATPTGDVKLVKTISIPTPMTGNFNAPLNVKDYGSENEVSSSAESFMEAIARQVCAISTYINNLRGINMNGCVGNNMTDADIIDIIFQYNSIFCDYNNRLSNLETVTYSGCDNACGTSPVTCSPSTAFNNLSSTACSQASEIAALKREIQTLKDVQTSNSGSNGAGGLQNNNTVIGDGNTTPSNKIEDCTTGNCI